METDIKEKIQKSDGSSASNSATNIKINRHIKQVAVIGSGVMGSQIALHFANIGVRALLLDIVPKALNEQEKSKNLTLKDKPVRNRIVNSAFQQALKLKPNPVYDKKFISYITTGNLEDDLSKIAKVDWIIEVVTERLDIKQKVLAKIDELRKPGTFVTTNTSGIPINLLTKDRSEDFKKYFCGTHFFNPPRYLRLLEIIPSQFTHPDIIEFFLHYGDKFLGKQTVLCKDTPAFIANRIGVFSIMAVFHAIKDLKMCPEEVDKLTGTLIGRPKSATFRTADVVGLDTLVNVATGLQENLKDDEAKHLFKLPDYLKKMVDNNWLGQKTGQGFYKKEKDQNGNNNILSLNLDTLKYEARKKVNYQSVEMAKQAKTIEERLQILVNSKDKVGEFFRQSFYALFAYASHRIPEIADEIYRIDEALQAGFGWEMGPFKVWDALGVQATVKVMEKTDNKPAKWVYKMLDAGCKSFYKIENGAETYFDIEKTTYKAVPGRDAFIFLKNKKTVSTPVWKNSGVDIIDLGDGILNVEFHTKMNAIGSEIIQGVTKAVDIAENDGWKGIVIANEGDNFCAGANIAMILMLAIEQEWDELNFAVKAFQNMNMRIRYSDIPVVAAPHNLTLGGGCELVLHADAVVASAETYIGMVETGVGLIPGGGGTKEMAMRLGDSLVPGDVKVNRLRQTFLNIGQAKVATSGWEAYNLGYFLNGRDKIIVNRNRQIAEAKQEALRLYNLGYTRPVPRMDVKISGKESLGLVYAGANAMLSGNYISEHDKLISEKLGYILCGGAVSEPSEVSEQYLLDLEREAFLSLLGTKKTLQRMQHTLKTGKPLRN